MMATENMKNMKIVKVEVTVWGEDEQGNLDRVYVMRLVDGVRDWRMTSPPQIVTCGIDRALVGMIDEARHANSSAKAHDDRHVVVRGTKGVDDGAGDKGAVGVSPEPDRAPDGGSGRPHKGVPEPAAEDREAGETREYDEGVKRKTQAASGDACAGSGPGLIDYTGRYLERREEERRLQEAAKLVKLLRGIVSW